MDYIYKNYYICSIETQEKKMAEFKKYRKYDTPNGWCYDMIYADVMQLRSAYAKGIKTSKTLEACRIYMDWRKHKQNLKGGK